MQKTASDVRYSDKIRAKRLAAGLDAGAFSGRAQNQLQSHSSSTRMQNMLLQRSNTSMRREVTDLKKASLEQLGIEKTKSRERYQVHACPPKYTAYCRTGDRVTLLCVCGSGEDCGQAGAQAPARRNGATGGRTESNREENEERQGEEAEEWHRGQGGGPGRTECTRLDGLGDTAVGGGVYTWVLCILRCRYYLVCSVCSTRTCRVSQYHTHTRARARAYLLCHEALYRGSCLMYVSCLVVGCIHSVADQGRHCQPSNPGDESDQAAIRGGAQRGGGGR
jgi:hypothetical protein